MISITRLAESISGAGGVKKPLDHTAVSENAILNQSGTILIFPSGWTGVPYFLTNT
jgi:hypothetical protein